MIALLIYPAPYSLRIRGTVHLGSATDVAIVLVRCTTVAPAAGSDRAVMCLTMDSKAAAGISQGCEQVRVCQTSQYHIPFRVERCLED